MQWLQRPKTFWRCVLLLSEPVSYLFMGGKLCFNDSVLQLHRALVFAPCCDNKKSQQRTYIELCYLDTTRKVSSTPGRQNYDKN